MPVVNGGGVSNAPASGGAVPFAVGTTNYAEKIFTDTYQLSAGGTQEFVHNITPGGFLRGIRLLVSCASGAGATAATADNPWNLIQNVSIENIDGSPILYPMTGYSAMLTQKYFQPWLGDPVKRPTYVQGINPAMELYLRVELKDTAGVLANTDARAQYRVRYTVNTSAAIATGAYTTQPTVTVVGFMEAFSQPDSHDLHGNAIQALPDGLGLAHIVRHQVLPLNNAGALNQLQLNNTGNELRGLALVVRDSNNARQDYLTDPIRWRLDSRSMQVSSPNEVFSKMYDHYDFLANGTSSRETGVYVFPRFRYTQGENSFWLPTTNATYLVFETTTLGTGVNLPGTVEVITDEVVPVGAVPGYLEGI